MDGQGARTFRGRLDGNGVWNVDSTCGQLSKVPQTNNAVRVSSEPSLHFRQSEMRVLF